MKNLEELNSQFYLIKSAFLDLKEYIAPDLKTRYTEFLLREITMEQSYEIDKYFIQYTSLGDDELPTINEIRKAFNAILNPIAEYSEEGVIEILEAYSNDKVLPVVDRILKYNQLI